VIEKTALALAGHRHRGTIWGAESNILALTKGNPYMDFSFRNAGLFRCLGRRAFLLSRFKPSAKGHIEP